MELVKWCTPPNKDHYLLRLPVGTRGAFVDGYDKMEKNSFSSWHHHKVKKGENLGAIARQYGISVTELKQANDMKSDRIRAGKSLLIPIKVTPKKSTGKKPTKVKTYVVKQGDNLASVARLFGVSQDSVRAWNSLDAAAVVKPGDTLLVSKPEPKPSAGVVRAPLAKGEKYVVKSGDSYADIAKSFGVPVVMLLEANGGFNKRLTEGDSIVIPEFVQPKKQKGAKKQEPLVKKPEPKKEEVKFTGDVYVVQSGDNLFSISKKCNTTVADIQALNGMGNSTSIYPGQKLKVAGKAPAAASEAPKADDGFITHEVKKGEGLWDLARQYNVTIEDIVKWNGLSDTKIKVGERLKIKKPGK